MVPINIPHSQQAGRLAVRQSPLVAAWHVLGTAYFSKWGHFLGRLTGRYSGNVGNLPGEQFLSFDNLHHHHPTIICFSATSQEEEQEEGRKNCTGFILKNNLILLYLYV